MIKSVYVFVISGPCVLQRQAAVFGAAPAENLRGLSQMQQAEERGGTQPYTGACQVDPRVSVEQSTEKLYLYDTKSQCSNCWNISIFNLYYTQLSCWNKKNKVDKITHLGNFNMLNSKRSVKQNISGARQN